jgi:hypothetical protein
MSLSSWLWLMNTSGYLESAAVTSESSPRVLETAACRAASRLGVRRRRADQTNNFGKYSGASSYACALPVATSYIRSWLARAALHNGS